VDDSTSQFDITIEYSGYEMRREGRELTTSFGKSPNLYKALKRYVPDQNHLHYEQKPPLPLPVSPTFLNPNKHEPEVILCVDERRWLVDCR
jgi:hypothetical protein